jgi:pyridoxine 4-dehydrogenase
MEYNADLCRYSPIGRGMLTGEIKFLSDVPEGDFRRHMPRFQTDAFDVNMELVDEIQKVAEQKGCTPAQLAISWVKSLSEKVRFLLSLYYPSALHQN